MAINQDGRLHWIKSKMTKVNLEVIGFEAEMKRIQREFKALANKGIENRVEFATQSLKVVTPKDTGRASKGWKNKTYKGADGYLDGSINNDVEYISYLNNGHSKQAPRYFIEQVLTTIGIITPN